ncbi:MAG: serine/threonine protein kinase [Leptospiraceae bacterium]|nr:serine/threonine protein kinase [Leptospiraceae bacterium]MCK6382187.1 serine/threonine protein kinase [Leptospiraceae bacterium]
MNEYFYDLTPEKVILACEECGYSPTGRVFALNSYENRVFDVYLEDSQNIIVKFYRPGRWSKEEIQEEHDFLYELSENEIPVSKPIRFQNGESIREISGIYYSMWEKIGGRSPDEFTDTDLKIVGRLISRIHRIGRSKKSLHRPHVNSEEYVHKPLRFLTEKSFLPKSCAERYILTAEKIAEIYDEISLGVPTQRIHGDCHNGNLLNGNSGWFFLDFDDFRTGPVVQDLWMLLPSSVEFREHRRGVFLEAYSEFSEFQENWLNLVEPLRAFRYIHYSAWIARRWEDPTFPALFPHFGSTDYWEKETQDLESQLKFISKPRQKNIALPKIEDQEEKLTNKDFFWDMT